MASKSDILKRIQASKKGEPTWQDKNRLKTWKDAGQGSRDQKHGYERALRNMQRSAQQGQEFNKVDAQIVSSYVKETPEQLLKKSKDFVNLMMWLPIGGAAAKLGATAIKAGIRAATRGTTVTAKEAAKKAAAAKRGATPRSASAAAKETVKKAAAPVGRAGKEGVRKIVGKISGRTAAEATAKKALRAAQRRAQRARISARTKVLGDIAQGGVHTKGLARTADRAGRTAYNKVMRQHNKAARVTTAARKAKNLRRGQIAGAAALAAVPATVAGVKALSGDRKTEKTTVKPPRPRRKPGGAEVYFERARRDREEATDKAADEKKAITRSRAGRDTGIGAGREREQEVQNIVRDLAHQDPTGKYYPSRGTRRALKPLEGGVRYYTLPDWLGGGRIKADSTFREEEGDNVTHGKKGGQVKKGVKKTKAKARKAKAKTRKRAALRGHRAELRGG